MTGLTESLARFAADPQLDTPPEAATRIARTGFIDAIATMLAGRDEPVVQIVRRFVAERRSAVQEASLLLGSEMAAAADAALINATAAHALDYDDYIVSMPGHPSDSAAIQNHPGALFTILDSDHAMDHVLAELRSLRDILRPGDYLIRQ